MANLEMRLVVYENDTPIDVLPRPLDIQWGGPMNDTPTLQFSYSKYEAVERADLIERIYDEQLDVAVEINKGSGWVEPPSARFVMVDDADDTSDQQHVVTHTGIGVDNDLAGVVIDDSTGLSNEGRRVFTNASPGQFMVTFLNYAQTTGQINLLDWDFTVDKASGDADWTSSLTWEVDRSTNAKTILDTLVGYGMCNWRCEGNTFRMFVDGSDGTVSDDYGMQVDRTDGPNPVELVMGREVIDGPQTRSRRNLANRALVTSDNNAAWLQTDNTTYIRRGKRTITISQGGISTSGAANVIGGKALEAASAKREQLTRTLKFDSSVQWLPWLDYKPGDWVYAPGRSYGEIERLRIRQITLTQDQYGTVSGSIILNDRFYERSVAQEKALQAIQNGAVVGGGGGSTQPSAPSRKPSRPAGNPTVSGAAYVDASGHIRAVINLQWPGVTTGTDGQAIDIDRYEVRIRKRQQN